MAIDMSRDQMLELLHELESAAEAYNAGYSNAKLAKAVAWLEDDGNEDYFEHKGYLYTGWLLTSPE